MSTVKLRPHHILCTQNFVGHGYNEEYADHMKRMIDDLVQGGDIILHEGCDDICSKCPNNDEGKCTSLDKVDRMDRDVLKVCGLAYGERLKYKDASLQAKEKIFATEEFARICGDCEWYETCKRILF